MKFSFGLGRKRQSKNPAGGITVNDHDPVLPVHPVVQETAASCPEPAGALTEADARPNLRILAFGNKEDEGNVYTLFLRSKGYDVQHFSVPTSCALLENGHSRCTREHACADLFLIDMEMEGLTGLELIRHQHESGCRSAAKFKAILAHSFTHRQEYDIRALGCIPMRKPFRLKDLLAWVSRIESDLQPDRKLVPLGDLCDQERQA